MVKLTFKRLSWFSLGAGLLLAAVVLGPRLFTGLVTYTSIQPADRIEPRPVAIVFGAGLRRDGRPSAVLRDRVRSAADLYLDGKVDLLLLSGYDNQSQYDEPEAMFNYALSLGVPESALVQDNAGSSTYATCFRAAAVFQVEEAILVTQAYHLPRAIYTCRNLGLSATGVPAHESRYWEGALAFWKFRELFATLAALWEIHVVQPVPVHDGLDPIMKGAQ